MSIKKNKKLFGLALLTLALSGCQGSGGSGEGTTDGRVDEGNNDPVVEQPGQKPDPTPEPKPDPEKDFVADAWPFELGQSDMVAAAKVAGYYAVAKASSMDVEIRDISQAVLHTVSADDMNDLGFSSGAQLCGMTFTPSGRLLYMAVCNQGSGEDAILAFNTNTQKLSVFDRVSLHSGSDAPLQHYGMSYFKSKLYVGSEQGVYRYDASRNIAYQGGTEPDSEPLKTPLPVKDFALDMVDEKLYVLTEGAVYRLPVDASDEVPFAEQALSKVYEGSNLSRIGFSRVFGRESLAGLYLTRNTGNGSEVLFAPDEKVRKAGAFSPELLMANEAQLLDFTTTPDGKLFYSNGQAFTLTDRLDDKMSYKAWLQDELAQYVTAIKSLIASKNFPTTNDFSPEGFLHRKIQKVGTNPNVTPIADTVGWAIYLLLAADQVSYDPEIEPLIELLIERHAGLMRDGLGGLKSVDGHFVRNYEADGSPKLFEIDDETGELKGAGPQTQVYTSMKFLPAVIQAAEQYPDNTKIAEAKQYLRQIFVRSSDTIRARQGVTWRNDDYGPIKEANGMANETWIYGDLGAAQDPLATYNYATYVYERDNFDKDEWLAGEPVIKSSHAAFIVMGGTLVLEHHFEDPHWQEQNNNYYAVTQAETDDMGAPYFAAFSAGNNTSPDKKGSGNYYNDGPSDHPGDILHFPALLGFGQHGKQGAMVGGYFAYRNDLRQMMINSANDKVNDIEMLTRWSMSIDDYEMEAIGIADFWFGAIGLAETIRPGTTKELRNTFYRPDVSKGMDPEGSQVVKFSALTPRHVVGVRQDESKQSFGFQRSPFTVPGGEHFARFEAIDPEGDWVELDDIVSAKEGRTPIFSNPDFENGLDDWQHLGGGSATIVEGIYGQGAKVRSSSAGESILTQAVEQSIALEGSKYKVSAFIRPEQVSDGRGFIRAFWSESGDRNAPLGEAVDSSSEVVAHDGQLVSVNSYKPAGANYLHIEYVVDGAAEQSFMFDNTSLQLIGALEEIPNGDFELGDDGSWDLSKTNKVGIISTEGDIPQGKLALEFVLNGTSSWQKVEREIDVKSDPDGTRYIYKLSLGEHNINEDTEFDIDVDVVNPTVVDDKPKQPTRPSVATIEKDSPNEIAFVMRKRPGDEKFIVTFKMRQSNESTATDRVVIDNFRVYKQQIFDAGQCIAFELSATGCKDHTL